MLKEGAASGGSTPAERLRSDNEAVARCEAPVVLLLGPARSAASGVATHINQLFGSALSKRFRLSLFQVGSEGRGESGGATVVRLALSPVALIVRLAWLRPRIVHINTSLDLKGYWRDLVYLAVAKVLGCKVVYQVHGGALPGQFFPHSRLLTALLRRVLMWADVVVLLAKCEMTAYQQFVPRARLIRIANCVPIEEGRGPVALDSAAVLTVAYIGRLTASKGILETVEAVRILRGRGTQIRLTIAGAGEALVRFGAPSQRAAWPLRCISWAKSSQRRSVGCGARPMFWRCRATTRACRTRCWRPWRAAWYRSPHPWEPFLT